MKQKGKTNEQKKNKNFGSKSGSVVLNVHTQVQLTLDEINLRRVDIALLPENFELVQKYANLYQRYKVNKGKWRFYALRQVNAIQTPLLPIYPVMVY